MNKSPDWVKIVRFVRDSLGWTIDAQALDTGLSSTTLYEWCREGRIPGVASWAKYMRWVLTLSCVRNYCSSGAWAMPCARFSHRHQVFLLPSFDEWMILYFYDGDLLEVDSGKFSRGQSLESLLVELADMTGIRMEEIEREHGVRCA
jgi:hypothetical protein